MIYCGEDCSLDCKDRIGIVDVFGECDAQMYLTNSSDALYEIIEQNIITALSEMDVTYHQVHQWQYEIRFKESFDFNEFKALLESNALELQRNKLQLEEVL